MATIYRKKPKRPTLHTLYRDNIGLWPAKETRAKVSKFKVAAKKAGHSKTKIEEFLRLPG